jgi:flagellar biosynthesis/type III secretory pathway M-ring protein FliF/YscJ
MGSFKQFLFVLFACLLSIGVVVAQSPTMNATETHDSNSTSISASTTSASIQVTPSISSSPITTSYSDTMYAVPTVQSTGFNSSGNEQSGNQQSWLRQNNRFVFVIFIGLIVLSILIWYIYRSVKGMRKRLEQENQAQLYMMQQATSPHPPPPTQNRNDRVIPESAPAYKTEDIQPITNTQRY